LSWQALKIPTQISPSRTDVIGKTENKSPSKSELDHIIQPEIKHDEFYDTITRLAATLEITTILEIGSSSGGGSTEAFINGLSANPKKTILYCLEVSLPRFQALKQRYGQLPFVHCLNASSVPVASFPSTDQVREFYSTHTTKLNLYPLEQVLGWLEQDIRYINEWQVLGEGINEIKVRNCIQTFDMVLIDGSEFSGEAELERVYGARYILLDDVASYKNFTNRARLIHDSDYELFCENLNLRNGYSIFKKKDIPDRESRQLLFINEVIKTGKVKKIIHKTGSELKMANLIPSELQDHDLCIIETNMVQAERSKKLCISKNLHHIVLKEIDTNDLIRETAGEVASALTVALGRMNYRPDLLVLDGSTSSFIEEWLAIEPQLLKNCLISAVSLNSYQLEALVRAVKDKFPQLQEVAVEPDNGVVLFFYDIQAQLIPAKSHDHLRSMALSV
jgi:hypothetical protein